MFTAWYIIYELTIFLKGGIQHFLMFHNNNFVTDGDVLNTNAGLN